MNTKRQRADGTNPPISGQPPTVVNPRYEGATMVEVARLVMRPADPQARETLRQLQARVAPPVKSAL